MLVAWGTKLFPGGDSVPEIPGDPETVLSFSSMEAGGRRRTERERERELCDWQKRNGEEGGGEVLNKRGSLQMAPEVEGCVSFFFFILTLM